MDDFVIPIDGALEGFYEHMKANPRTILSSKFGDGKSYFLKEFKDAEFVKKDYVFLTIYPVNYQVASNEDIFSLIKRDVIYQLLWNEMISDDVAISNDIICGFSCKIRVSLFLQIYFLTCQQLLFQMSISLW